MKTSRAGRTKSNNRQLLETITTSWYPRAIKLKVYNHTHIKKKTLQWWTSLIWGVMGNLRVTLIPQDAKSPAGKRGGFPNHLLKKTRRSKVIWIMPRILIYMTGNPTHHRDDAHTWHFIKLWRNAPHKHTTQIYHTNTPGLLFNVKRSVLHTYRLNLQGVSIAPEKSGLGFQERSGDPISSGHGDLLQPAFQRGDLGEEQEGEVSIWKALKRKPCRGFAATDGKNWKVGEPVGIGVGIHY